MPCPSTSWASVVLTEINTYNISLSLGVNWLLDVNCGGGTNPLAWWQCNKLFELCNDYESCSCRAWIFLGPKPFSLKRTLIKLTTNSTYFSLRVPPFCRFIERGSIGSLFDVRKCNECRPCLIQTFVWAWSFLSKWTLIFPPIFKRQLLLNVSSGEPTLWQESRVTAYLNYAMAMRVILFKWSQVLNRSYRNKHL